MGLKVENLSVELSGTPILFNIDAEFQAKRICAILGPNGAGKSTLLKAIAGLVPMATGQITLGARALTEVSPKIRAQKIAYLPQNYHVSWDIKVRDVIALGRYAHGDTGAEAIEQAMIATDTTQFAERTTSQLSGGELARVMLARVLAGQPDWILADEPLASLDPAYQIDMVSRFREVADSGTAIVIVLHDINLAAKLADDVLMLKEGQLLTAGSADAELNAQNLSRLYDIEVKTISAKSTNGAPLFQLG